jgi:Zn-dependent protease
MKFRLFGVDVEVQITFWVTAVLLGLQTVSHDGELEISRGAAIAIWVAVVFVSVMLHELGHAFVLKRHGLAPTVTLYALGGITQHAPTVPLRRRDHVVVSLAGPFAGFVLGGGILAIDHFLPSAFAHVSAAGLFALKSLLWVNLAWGVVNLLPVLPLDGGHVLLHALGPRHRQLTAAISTLVGVLVAALFFSQKAFLGGLIFALAAVQSYRRFTAGGNEEEVGPSPPPERIPADLAAMLQAASSALAEDDLDRAASLAHDVLAAPAPPPAARREAFEVIAWTHLLGGSPENATATLALVQQIGEPDRALLGAVLFARGDLAAARRVLEGARADGDDRKQIVAPLVQILIAQREAGRAAEVALSVVETLSEEDARRMASIAAEHGAFSAAARLYVAMFERLHQPEDAYEAARAEALAGQPERALDLLRRAVAAGFSDRARGWSDAALATLQGALEAVLGPRP